MMQTIEVSLNIPADEYLALYQGQVKNVYAKSIDGRSVMFPARILQPYVLHSGIQGRFRITFDVNGRYQTIDRVSD